MACEYLTECIFYNDNLNTKPIISGMMKKRYCEDKFDECARYRVRKILGKDRVPKTLYPSHIEEATRILADAGISE